MFQLLSCFDSWYSVHDTMLVCFVTKRKAHSLQLFTPVVILQKHVYVCLPDRNYVQDETCLQDQDSFHEDLPDSAPLTHDDLGCPIRRDRLYYHKPEGATAKPVTGPPVSPSLFRSPRSSAPERPSPKDIQTSIKESATLAAAISMQWKEEVSAMRRELAELRRDLCKELRAFNTNFNTFTQHYNTWSPQGGSMATGSGASLDKVAGTGSETGTKVEAHQEMGGVGNSAADKDIGGAREKTARVAKVSVGIQAKSKVLVRQSTADAAVNCPEEKDERKNARRNLPKQLSMDPSILSSPQSMYVESAIPLSLDPILIGSTKTDSTFAPSTSKPNPAPVMPVKTTATSSDPVTNERLITQETITLLSGTDHKSAQNSSAMKQEVITTPQLTDVVPTSNCRSHTELSQSDNLKSQNSEQIEQDKIKLPYPVPTVTVSPPEEHESDIDSDPEFVGLFIDNKPHPVSQDPPAVVLPCSGSDPSDTVEIKPKAAKISKEGPSSVCDVPSRQPDAVTPCNLQTEIKCPSIVVSEYFDTDSPLSPTETNLDPVISVPDYPSELPPEQVISVSTFASSSADSQPNTEEWPPLPDPLEATRIFHADLVHFDLVMLTSLDQDDLDSVFMDPEPEPFNLSTDSSFNAEDLEPPAYQFDSQSSPVPSADLDTKCFTDLSAEIDCLEDPSEHMTHYVASESQEVLFPQVVVTISPPSSVSPDTSLEIDFWPTSPGPELSLSDTEPPSPDLQELMQPGDIMSETLECVAVSLEAVGTVEEETLSSSGRSSVEQTFLWHRWQRRSNRRHSVRRSASVELWSGRYEYNSSEITYVSLTL